MTELAKTFEPGPIEAKWYQHWEEKGLFRPDRPDAEAYTIVNPPPNVTGSLHIGHALDNTLQDIMIRYERLRGKDALWVVGVDHAGIATQMVVERQMEARQDKRTNYSREEFVQKVWEWKEESGGQITRQLRRLGCSMDWSREQFTMDPHFSDAVLKVFVDLYNDGLIYRDKRLVNWDVKLKTAISDLEVETIETKGGFWHFKYPLSGGAKTAEGKDYLVVATTRPETMLADMAVAVHPEDERYQSVIGKMIDHPITGRQIPVVADEHADPELGSGCVKITPGHDFNDFDVGKRAGMKPAEMLNMLDGNGNVCQTADGLIPDEFLGLHRFKKDGVDGAREAVVARMKADGFLIPHVDKEGVEHDAEPRTIQTPFGDRGGVVIEPWLTDQWYVDAEKLAQKPIEAVRNGDIEIVPKTWEKTFFNWMENIQPWCVSRQLWWGHQIPAWYGMKFDEVHSTGAKIVGTEVFVATCEEEALELARRHYLSSSVINDDFSPENVIVVENADAAEDAFWDENKIPIWRDEDVLDTWFSSALWPFATLGWPLGQEPRMAGYSLKQSIYSQHQDPDPMVVAEWNEKRAEWDNWNAAKSRIDKHYPNDLLISGFDILFFWDARMMMMGRQLTGENPWPRLYLHGLVRAADGAKMSKSKGNVVDPLGLVDKYGADALRFFMAAMESQGRDIKMDNKRVEGYRNFATKIWNAARFLQANGIGASDTIAAPDAAKPVNKWIIGEVVETLAKLEKAFDELRFDGMADAIYHFAWGTFCDWYLELIKGEMDEETKAVAAWAFDQILVMLHPFMPFVTEELWGAMGAGERDHYPLITAKWPEPEAGVDAEAKSEIDWTVALVSEVRALRAELNIPWSSRLTLHPLDGGRTDAASALDRQGKADWGEPIDSAPAGSAQIVVAGKSYAVPLADAIDLDAERARLAKAAEAADKEVKSLEGRLNNPNFVERAKPEAVEKARADHAERKEEADRLRAALSRLG
ncbi:valine--tRNA ligase [Sphingomicrobium nitratireducens]|uniref:valine--tRNA ligase n=1 Tax=Sphingomicrobium nitratireducens TaxID=2964666 RepID=UPI002240C909|nr:valine--tRNA ligase [Sphingomicrobium nitratireducens]